MAAIRTTISTVPTWRALLWTVLGCLLLAPLVAMNVTDEVAWTPSDFAMAAALLAGFGVAIEGVARFRLRFASRALIMTALAALALLFWAQGAVGVF